MQLKTYQVESWINSDLPNEGPRASIVPLSQLLFPLLWGIFIIIKT